MRKHKIICVIIVLFALSGCGSIDAGVLNYADHAFYADVEGMLNGLDFTARVQVGAPSEDNARSINIQFSSPESLDGIVVARDADGTTVSLDGVVITDAAAQGWLAVAHALIPAGQVVNIKKEEGNAAVATVALDSKQTIVIDLNTGAPLEATLDGVNVRVIRFEYTE